MGCTDWEVCGGWDAGAADVLLAAPDCTVLVAEEAGLSETASLSEEEEPKMDEGTAGAAAEDVCGAGCSGSWMLLFSVNSCSKGGGLEEAASLEPALDEVLPLISGEDDNPGWLGEPGAEFSGEERGDLALDLERVLTGVRATAATLSDMVNKKSSKTGQGKTNRSVEDIKMSWYKEEIPKLG